MTQRMRDLFRSIVAHCDIAGPVLEIGSFIEPVQADLNLRSVFKAGTKYVGCDPNTGLGVDEIASLLDKSRMAECEVKVQPRVVVCLYVLEHVWEIQAAAAALGALWRGTGREAWMFVATHQNQPYHGYGPEHPEMYDDYWRVTRVGMRRLMDEAGITGGRLFMYPDAANPEDVLLVRQPASMEWPGEALERAWRESGDNWEVR